MENESDRNEELISKHLEETISDDEFTELKGALRNCAATRSRYLELVKCDTLLREIAGSQSDAPLPKKARNRTPLLLLSTLVPAVALLLVFLFGKSKVAELSLVSSNAHWITSPLIAGDGLFKGQKLQLAAGSAEILFSTGATTRLRAPALLEIVSGNMALLHHGEAVSRADTETSRGFTIQTHAGNFVDRGTEFFTSANTDGFSQMHVASGSVDVVVDGFELQRLNQGSGLGIEPGTAPICIRIEPGEATRDFIFPTIPQPSAVDFATKAAVRIYKSGSRWEEISPHVESGSSNLVTDGKGQSAQDRPEQSLFLPNGAEGSIFMDLGTEVSIDRIYTYSWHLSEVDKGKRRRAVQRYTLWGCGENKPDTLPGSGNQQGWTRIARVDTDTFFEVESDPDRPAQQACALFAGEEQTLGTYRYLLFDLVPTPMQNGTPPRHTFFGEIDVFTTPQN